MLDILFDLLIATIFIFGFGGACLLELVDMWNDRD